MKSEIEETVHQHRKASGQRPGCDAAPELVIRFAAREAFTEKNYDEGQSQCSTDNAPIGQGLQIVIVRLLETK